MSLQIGVFVATENLPITDYDRKMILLKHTYVRNDQVRVDYVEEYNMCMI